MWREATNAFQQIAAWQTGGPGINLTVGDRPEHLAAINASAELPAPRATRVSPLEALRS